jgi:hypothetical protein
LLICHWPSLISFNQPFTHGFPRADIHELLSPDLLHQVIKGTFKDHLVEWVIEYLHATHGEARALEIIADIDHRCVRLHSSSDALFRLVSESLLFLPSLAFVGFQMAVTLRSGLETTPKRS